MNNASDSPELPDPPETNPPVGQGAAGTPLSLASRILAQANDGPSTADFLCDVTAMLRAFSASDVVELRVIERGRLVRVEAAGEAKTVMYPASAPGLPPGDGGVLPCLDLVSDLEIVCREVACRRADPALPCYTVNGSFWIGDARQPLELSSETCRWAGGRTLHLGEQFGSLAIIPFSASEQDRCLLLLKSCAPHRFSLREIEVCEDLARIIGIALTQLRAQVALRERVKELMCLYGIARTAAAPGVSLDGILQEVVQLLPPAWLHPDAATARIVFNGNSFCSAGFQECPQRQAAPIVVDGKKRGTVEVAYTREMPELDEGPFLQEERSLIDAVAGEMALIIERKQVEKDRERLRNQLRHADRLATIGQLAAGVAHELNEPLGNILGFAQLAQKAPGIEEQVRKDLEKIVSASLHAREVVRKLLIFARESPPQKNRLNLNRIVAEGLYFLESRCAKGGIELVRILDPDAPEITADSGQVYQVLVNLVVNAIQALPSGGRITIRTARRENGVSLIVEDSGVGMDDDVLDKIFLPFFTTKDVHEGTGLGLAVVHGIVTAHGGTIAVESKVGQGSRFDILWPADGPAETEHADEDAHAGR